MFRFSLITPEKVLFAGDVISVLLPTAAGQIQVLAHHMPLISALSPGELTIVGSDGATHTVVSSGFIEISETGDVVVLANTAEVALEVDVERAEAARLRARELLKGKIASEAEYAHVIAAIEKEWARARVGRKHLSRRRPPTGA